ncbi:MAG: hypothetical protein H6665_00540 [Ardenticatenaceae bacterium]|nr:hypothetical protein [Ardenticatenaceae bacterium]
MSSLNSLLQRAKQAPLWLILLVSLAAYSLFPLWFPLLGRYSTYPLSDIRTFTPSLGSGLGYALLLGALFIFYELAVRRAQERALRPLPILLITLIFCLPLLFTYPINATDIYRYFIRGRISSVYGDSPFSTPPNTFSDDPYLSLAGEWAGETSPYGPLWETAAAVITYLAPNNLLAGLLLFKALGLILHLAVGVLLYLWQKAPPATPDAPHPTPDAFLWWLWNPALLLTFVVDAHNDVMMLFWLVWGAWLLRNGRSTIGFLMMVMAPLTKPIALLALPFFWLDAWRQQPRSAMWRFLLGTIGGTLTLVWLTFLPFGSPVELAMRLWHEAADVGGFSPVILVILIANSLGLPVPNAVITNLALVLFALVTLWLVWRLWRGGSPLRATANIYLAYILTASSFRIWYTAWAFPWLLLDTPQRQRLGKTFLLTAQFSVLIYGHLRVYVLGGQHLLAHLIGVPITFALPFFIAYRRAQSTNR